MPPINLPDGIEALPITNWENGHQNFIHRFKDNASFKLRIPFLPATKADQYRQTTANFQWLIQHAIDNNLKLRAVGNGWSFNDIMVCDGGMIDTKALRLSFWVPNNYIHADYLAAGKGPGDLVFVECGMSILDIHEKLEVQANPRRSLKASGASNGQSIAGATSTGTHGSAYRVGAVHDTILGLHVVVGANRHVWIERASAPVASPEFLTWLGAELIRDDDMFNSAVVSFGSFGFIHGIMLETEPIYLLAEQRADQFTYDDDLVHALETLDFTGIQMKLPYPPDGPDKHLYHFEVIINPHHFAKDNKVKGVYLKTMYKMPYTPGYPKRQPPPGKFQYGENTLGVIETIIDSIPSPLQVALVPPLVNTFFPQAFKKAMDAFGTIGETFTNPKFRGKAISCAIGMDSSNIGRVVDIIMDVNHQTPFPGGMALRFIKGTKAMLGFTRFEKTCILELDGVDAQLSKDFFRQVWDEMELQQIPYTLHWGKFNANLTPQRVRQMYGDSAVVTWIACRHQLMDAATRNVFNNAFMQRAGLDA